MAKGKGGFIGQDGLNAPDSPTAVSGTAGDSSVSVAFTAPTDVGGSAITGYRVQDGTNAHGASGSSSPINVTGLTNGTAYTFSVWAINAFGYSAPSDASTGVSPATRGLFAGGNSSSNRNVIEFIAVSSTGNSTDFGDLLYSGSVGNQSTSSSTRALFGGGNNVNRDADQLTLLQYVTIATVGNALDFGDFTGNRLYTSSLSNETRGVFVGEELSNPADTMEYLTIASLGNSTDFGNLTTARSNMGSGSNTTRGVSAGGNITDGTAQNIIDYITIASTGNSTDFGDLTQARKALAGCSSTARTCFIGGSTGSNVNIIDFVTTASTGNATDFGDLGTAIRNNAALSSKIRGVSAGGESATADMQYITMASAGNSSTFGNLLSAKHSFSGCSSGHGGLS